MCTSMYMLTEKEKFGIWINMKKLHFHALNAQLLDIWFNIKFCIHPFSIADVEGVIVPTCHTSKEPPVYFLITSKLSNTPDF